ncbi:gamma-glutamyl-gamma-aminobutyrate hydrolase family protein [Aciduricibacillus chroicocephali]|uniref:Gamma-glutamyl-gamma-aminobutyrate hydrolase family protein n=1 Tax=Aciduricibacillus chroicocephali TaxID=3054939 RepID=A0ABY9KVN2_9BACI|nr:gamma-glutamyl-gamma-aminobutyrate hydrolase family protein [Bacillaceae bacterium 44XB]
MAEKKPIIGVSADIGVEEASNFPGHRQTFVYEDYVKAVEAAGGVPIVLPVTRDEEIIKQHAEEIDGLLLSGGVDINPLEYGEEPLENQGAIFPERDEFEIALVKAVIELEKPVFAICRGIQIMNIAYGGTLYQDLEYAPEHTLKHQQGSGRPGDESHTVFVEKGSWLHGIFGEEVRTNSFHHQAIKDVAAGFKVTAKSKDGIIEGIEKEGDCSIVGVQWHPERMADERDDMLRLFKHLVKEAS